jgi:hypothetical protein
MLKKRLLTFTLTLTLLFGLSTVAMAAEQGVKIKFNGKYLTADVDPVIKDKRTLVPVRAIAESLGADVDYDATTQVVTIKKVQDTYKLTLGKKEVIKNGEKMNLVLDVPAQTIGGRTMVPARFVSEVLGAKVDWDDKTFTVIINHEEVRNGMTPGELYTKVSESVYKYDTMKFKGSGNMSVQMSALPEPLDIGIEMEGAYKKPMDMWFKESIKPSGSLLPINETVAIEVYMKDNKMAMKAMDEPWMEQPMEFPKELTDLVVNYDPTKTGEMLDKFGMIVSHGNEATINGKTYYTLNFRFDRTKLMDMMDESAGMYPAPGMDPEELKAAQEQAKEMLKNLKFDFSYKVYVDKETLVMSKGECDGVMLMNLDGEKMTMKFNFDFDIYDYGVPVTIPVK